MDDWKSCDNCFFHDRETLYCLRFGCHAEHDAYCSNWEAVKCRCGGALSAPRYHNGREYRHCYACHAEFFIDEGEEK